MRTLTNYPVFLAVIFLIFAFSSCKADHIVLLYVDPGAPANAGLDPACECKMMISTDTKLMDDTSLIDFAIEVEPGDRIQWKGISPTHDVKIKKITFISGPTITDDPEYTGSKNISFKINPRAPSGVEVKYSLEFSSDPGSMPMVIDPKLMVK